MVKDPRFYEWRPDSPYRIYADGKWKGERQTPDWRRKALDFAEGSFKRIDAVSGILEQGGEGNMQEALCTLARELFFLHLTVRESSGRAVKALDLLSRYTAPAPVPAAAPEGKEGTLFQGSFRDLPFEPAEGPYFPLHAWLFSAAVFGKHKEKEWQGKAEEEGQRISPHSGSTETAELYNFLRGTLIVEGSAAIPGVISAVEELERRQDENGFWPGISPWHGYNVLAHSDLASAVRQLDKIEKNIIAMQNRDGSWGISGDEKPLATFLMAHALANRGFLK
ncbi:MAG: hypothetical protein H7A26_08585 [Spirochaetales bacterium]|nr:hypothetical protein [Spirochaetales bacterium]